MYVKVAFEGRVHVIDEMHGVLIVHHDYNGPSFKIFRERYIGINTCAYGGNLCTVGEYSKVKMKTAKREGRVGDAYGNFPTYYEITLKTSDATYDLIFEDEAVAEKVANLIVEKGLAEYIP